ncbi:RagB/SusD family nutrient uptake outer membrane protein [Flammeovirgaceae bacterium SG7u.111]|nr:RagB/SusD family nutrient uptake outer membrane protein [Flammeovirgaceae bacterium SG7u.132]WPO35150.1 RagB/SusD family nutrient uptake outer membrane protein [Flammeovirgaceae bacterium SG7u.111]
MKRLNKHIITAALAIIGLVCSCTNLEESPYDVLTDKDLGGSPEVLEALTAPVYTSLTDVMFGWIGYFDMQAECADIIVTPARPNGWVDGGTYRAMHMHNWNAFQAHPSGLWSRAYSALNILNTSLGTYSQMEGVESLVSELRALRALYYYLLIDNFGNVPIVTEVDLTKEDFLPTQSTRAEVFAYIESELKEVIPMLSEEKVYGKMNKWAAKMILAKTYLNAEVYIGQAKYNEAIAQVDDIIASGLYSLESNYHSNFAVENEGSSEQIFSIVFDATRSGWLHYPWKTLHPSSSATYKLGAQPWGGSCAIPQFIDTYDEGDSRLNIWIKGPQFSSSGEPIYNSMDPALVNTQLNYTKEIGNVDETKEYEGYRVGKFEIETGVTGTAISNDVPFFRYADALMIKAECLLRNGDAAGAAVIVSTVRERAFPDSPEKATVTADDLLKGSIYNYGNYSQGEMLTTEGGDDIQYGRFLDELGYEFAAEFHRRQDLIRFGVFTTKSWLTHTPNGDYRTIFPIPQSAINANPNLKQNPGY